MINPCTLLIFTFFLIHLSEQDNPTNLECSDTMKTERTLNVFITSNRTHTGDWVTTFTARKSSKLSSNNITLDVTQKVMHCEGNQVVYIHGVLTEIPSEKCTNGLIFHQNHGTNVAIVNDGRTAQKLNIEESLYSVLLTHRPLKVNELFEVRVDRKGSKMKFAWGIGVTTHSPDKIDIPKHMNHIKTHLWIIYHGNIYINATNVLNGYVRKLDDLQVGDKFGLMKNQFGSLLYFVNGIDQGPIATNIPETVYGALELYGDAIKGTIVQSDSSCLS